MTTEHDSAPRVGTRLTRRTPRAFRAGVLVTACLGVVGFASGAAEAYAGCAVVADSAHALANPGHPTVFRDTFDVHQLGAVTAAGARNQAEAESVACRASSPCRSISLSFQIVTMAGEDIHLDAVNLGNSTNVHCDGCQTLAGAYQFIVSTPHPFSLTSDELARLRRIHAELTALGSSTASIDQVKADADALAAQVKAILTNAAAAGAASTHTGMRPLTATQQPHVTLHRMFDQG
ncbi:hypothetical protein KDK95_31235 [Actinospica sp. MGRD01-02]|uniref:Uncharacterized protein n=1 Tax=Actinospica acidithermotolerans TaxID=2828514 RepID=A0A941IKP1_9ACTN|nr:hypothetical protein [Actinospica acidithermotolerans]MBR7830819.1 hypothetical protein [Actinospica acidithermotolerans]